MSGDSLVRGERHGPLPVLLLALTAATGLVDAVSVLGLGRVFVANMTGNVAFLGFALAGAPGFALLASLTALLGFVAGALGGGVLVRRRWADRRRALLVAVAAEAVLTAVAVLLLVLHAGAAAEVSGAFAAVLSAVLAIGLGARTSVVRHLAVPDLTTTVLTMTLTGIAADLRARRGVLTRRVLAVLVMLLGAVAGTLLVRTFGLASALLAVLVVVLVVAAVLLRGAGENWTRSGVESAGPGSTQR